MVRKDKMKFFAYIIFSALILTLYLENISVSAKTDIRFTETTTAVVKGKKAQFSVNSSEVDWSVSDTLKADISKNGKLTAKTTGWVTVKAKIKDNGKTVKQKILIVNKEGTVSNQKQLNAVLFAPKVIKITIKTEKNKKFIIEGDYPEKKLLVVDAPESEIDIFNRENIQEIYEIRGKVNDKNEEEEEWVGPGALDEKIFQAVITEFYSQNEMEVEYIKLLYGADIYQPGTKLRIRFEPEKVDFVPKEWWNPETPILHNIALSVGDKVRIVISTSDVGNDILEAQRVCIAESEELT